MRALNGYLNNMSTGLKLYAETEDGLTVLSAALQDAIAKVGDIRFDAQARTFVVRTSRFMHEKKSAKRVQSGVQFENILSVQGKDIDRSDPQAYLVLLSIDFTADKTPPGGEICLKFAGGGEVRLQAEYIEVRLVDYLQERDTDKHPLHPVG